MLGIATQSATIRPTSSIVLATPGAADGNYHAIRDPTPHIPDSVCQSQNRQCQSYVNYHAVHPPTPRFCDRVDRYASEPSLSRGKGAILVPKVPRSTAYFLGRLHRLRAPAPYKRESSIVLPDPGYPGGGTQMCTVKHVTFATLRLASSIVLSSRKVVDRNYREIRHPTSHIPDSVGKSKNQRCQSYVNYHAVHPPTPHFRDRVDRSANGPRLSRGKGAILVPKVPYFPAYSLAGSHRLRAPAP